MRKSQIVEDHRDFYETHLKVHVRRREATATTRDRAIEKRTAEKNPTHVAKARVRNEVTRRGAARNPLGASRSLSSALVQSPYFSRSPLAATFSSVVPLFLPDVQRKVSRCYLKPLSGISRSQIVGSTGCFLKVLEFDRLFLTKFRFVRSQLT